MLGNPVFRRPNVLPLSRVRPYRTRLRAERGAEAPGQRTAARRLLRRVRRRGQNDVDSRCDSGLAAMTRYEWVHFGLAGIGIVIVRCAKLNGLSRNLSSKP